MPRGRPLLRRLCLPFCHECMPSIHGWCRNGGSNAGFRLTKAVPCHWTIAALQWCWLEELEPPPLAYKASAQPDELSQLCKWIAAPLPEWKRPCGCARFGAASNSGRSQCQRARRQPAP